MEKKNPVYTLKEEIWHGASHGIGAALSIAALVILVVMAAKRGDPWRVVSFSIYGSSLFTLYLASTLYHSFTNEKLKKFFRKFDHLSIFLLIAGTYTPVTLISLRGPWGWTLFGLIWAMAAGGIIYELLFIGRWKWVTVAIYVGMGWLALIAIKPMIETMPLALLLWILAGGVFYTGGVVFYVKKSMPYHHVLWHFFVLLGSASHFIGILRYLT